jgi:hypothetical protein
MPLTAEFDLPVGWVRLPPPDARPKGMLRRDPFELLARQLVTGGAVIETMTEAAAQYIRRIASADPAALAVASLIQVPSREDHTFVNFAVFAASPAPIGPDGDRAVERMRELAGRKGSESESHHRVEPVELPWGRGARSTWTRPRRGEPGVREFIGFWVIPNGIGSLITMLGDISAGATADPGRIVDDIDGLARSIRISLE